MDRIGAARRRTGDAIVALLAAAPLAVAAAPAGAQDGGSTYSFSTGFDYTSGDYGSTLDTEILYVPFTLKYETGSWLVWVTLPYIRITGPGTVVGGTDGAIVRKTDGAATRSTKDGVGDIVASLTYGLPRQTASQPLIEFTGKIKIPTASEKDGLGTGAFDYTFQVDASTTYGRVTPFGTLGYRIVGDPDGVRLDNIFLFSAGAGYELSRRSSLGMIFDYRQAAADGADDAVELTPYVAWKASDRWALNAYLVFGLTDGSPDHGVGMQVTTTW